ncbi:hypothetical protein OHAE_324 [Ochrobactrum soli]|uniref:Uncharacterized protein n=1 Tax=Ochrobactrum soli TaxID=2448455 RepID=A0A2P9HK26_9HYPH|nr:hypothetical protein OHAE_324 [[Ochrobactrum] soli]
MLNMVFFIGSIARNRRSNHGAHIERLLPGLQASLRDRKQNVAI